MTIDVLKVEWNIISSENVNSNVNLLIREMSCGNSSSCDDVQYGWMSLQFGKAVTKYYNGINEHNTSIGENSPRELNYEPKTLEAKAVKCGTVHTNKPRFSLARYYHNN